jgi:hypothetical protein
MPQASGVSRPSAKATVQVLAEAGKAYAIYVNGGTQAELELEFPAGRYKAEWLNTKTGIGLMIVSAVLSYFVQTPFIFPVILLCAGLITSLKFRAQPREDLPRRFGAASFHVRQSLLNPFDGFDPIEQRLVGRRILDHEFSLAVDGQHKRVSGRPQTVQQVNRVAFEVTERTDVVGKIEHGLLIKSASNLMVTRSCRRVQLL